MCHHLHHLSLKLGPLGYDHDTAPLRIVSAEPTCGLDSFPPRLLGRAAKERGQLYLPPFPHSPIKGSKMPKLLLGLHRHLLCPLGQCHHDKSQERTRECWLRTLWLRLSVFVSVWLDIPTNSVSPRQLFCGDRPCHELRRWQAHAVPTSSLIPCDYLVQPQLTRKAQSM